MAQNKQKQSEHISITQGTLVARRENEEQFQKSKFADRATMVGSGEGRTGFRSSWNKGTRVEPETGEAVEPDIDDTFPLSDRTFNKFAETIGQLESSGRYDIVGGSGNAYDGKYQMGRMAKADAAKRLGITVKHDAASREAFRQDADLQDDMFEAFTFGNHETLMRLSNKYKSSSRAEKAQALAVAHLLGAGGAIEYLNGNDGTDGFGTSGSKYAEAIKTALAS